MSRENMDALKTAEAKASALTTQFDNFNPNPYVSRDEIQSFLDHKVMNFEGDFDLEMLEGILQNVEFNNQGKVDKQEFSSSYVGAMNFIEEQIFTTRDKIADVRRLTQDYDKQHQQATQSEIKNDHGVMKGSVLTIRIIQASDLVPVAYGGTLDPFVVLEFGEQYIESTSKGKTLNPVWNESFTFDVSWLQEYPDKTQEYVTVKVFDKSQPVEGEDGTYSQIAEAQVLICNFSHQKNEEAWFDLRSTHSLSSSPNSKINLGVWWVHSQVDMLKALMDTCNEDAALLGENLDYYSNRFELLQVPLKQGAVSSIPKDFSADYTGAKALGNSGFSPNKTSDPEESKLGTIATMLLESHRRVANGFEKQSDRLFSRLGFDETPWYILLQISMYMHTILSLL